MARIVPALQVLIDSGEVRADNFDKVDRRAIALMQAVLRAGAVYDALHLVAAEGEAALRFVELHGGDAQIEEHARYSPRNLELLKHLPHAVVDGMDECDAVCVPGQALRREGESVLVAIETDVVETGEPLEDRLGVAAQPERAAGGQRHLAGDVDHLARPDRGADRGGGHLVRVMPVVDGVDDLDVEADEMVYQRTISPEAAPDKPEVFTMDFEKELSSSRSPYTYDLMTARIYM